MLKKRIKRMKAKPFTFLCGEAEIYHKWIGPDSPDTLTELQVQVK